MAPERGRKTERKTLRQSLQDLFRCRRKKSQVEQPRVIGSGILRKADPAISLLPLISSVSVFPDFGSSTFDVERLSISTPTTPQKRPAGDILIFSDYSVNNSTASLLPSTRLSQFNLHQAFIDKAASPQKVQYGTVPEILVPGASRHASFESYQTSARRSSSTLKLRRSSPSIVSSVTDPTSITSPGASSSGSARSHIQRGFGERNRQLPRPVRTPVSSKSSLEPGSQHGSYGINSAIKHFSSFCVLDTLAPGCPVTATSEDLRYIFDVGEQFFLHNQECDGTSFDIVTGHDAGGREITHLVLFSPLVSPSSGRSRFMLAALVDVTNFLQDAATLPELGTISEAMSEDEDFLPTPKPSRRPTPHPPWKSRASELSAEDLLGGCFVGGAVEEKESIDSQDPPRSEDIWLKLATEEKEKGSSSRGSRSSVGSPVSTSSAPSSTTSRSMVDTVLDEFMSSLQKLYSEFFLLAKSPLDDKFYEICNVSPSVNASRDYVQGHLSHTAPPDITRLSRKLGGEDPFSMQVRWGSKGQERQLYCIPLFGQSSITWICILVETRVPFLW